MGSLSEIFLPSLNKLFSSVLSLFTLTFSALILFSCFISFLLFSNLLSSFSQLFSSLVIKQFSIISSMSSVNLPDINSFKSSKKEFEISLNLQREFEIKISI